MDFFMKVPSKPVTIAILMSGFVMWGCDTGGSGNSRKNNRNVRPPVITDQAPVTYTLYDKDCVQQQSPVAITKTGIWGWEGLSVINTTAELSNTISSGSLRSDIVSETTFNRLYLRVCNGPSEFNCVKEDGSPKGWDLPKEKNQLRVCEDDFTYPRETFEAGALTSIHYLNLAADSYKEAMNRSLRKVRLEIFPLFETHFFGRTDKNGKKVNVKEYLVDNLAYYPGHDLIVVFPQSQKAAENGFDKFWESSFVLAHELGHHVEQAHIGADLRALGIYWDPTLHQFRGIQESGSKERERRRYLAKYWTAISEAFADLNAFYAEKEDINSLVNVDCLGANRNILNDMFADQQTAKRLDDSVVVSLFIRGSYQVNYCDSVNLSEPHTVGAIIAHNMHNIIKILEPETLDVPYSETIKARYRLSIAWIEALATAHRANKDRPLRAKTLLSPLRTAIMAIAANASDLQKQQICELATTMLPSLSPAPFARYCKGF